MLTAALAYIPVGLRQGLRPSLFVPARFRLDRHHHQNADSVLPRLCLLRPSPRPQVSPLNAHTLPDVPPPTTWTARTSLYTPTTACPVTFRLRSNPASSSPFPAESSSLPTDRQFASDCSPPRITATQLSSATGSWLTPTRTFTVLCARPHGRTGSDLCADALHSTAHPAIIAPAGEIVLDNQPASTWFPA